MKKFVAMLLALALVSPFALGCGDKKTEKKVEKTDGTTKTTETTTTEK